MVIKLKILYIIIPWGVSKRGSISEFIGIEISSGLEGGYKFTHKRLIKRVLETTVMNKCNKVLTLTKSVAPLGSDIYGAHSKEY